MGQVRTHIPQRVHSVWSGLLVTSTSILHAFAHFPQEMHLYCADNGRPSIDPVVKFKMVLIQHLYGLPSLRKNQNERSIQVVFEVFDE